MNPAEMKEKYTKVIAQVRDDYLRCDMETKVDKIVSFEIIAKFDRLHDLLTSTYNMFNCLTNKVGLDISYCGKAARSLQMFPTFGELTAGFVCISKRKPVVSVSTLCSLCCPS